MDFVYSQGPGAQREVLLNVPAATQSIVASSGPSGGEVVVSITTTGGTYDAAAPTIAHISSVSIGKKSGLVTLDIINNGGEVVLREP